jgi:hypothetical protein
MTKKWNVLVFDLETDGLLDRSVPDPHALLRVTVAVIHTPATGYVTFYGDDEASMEEMGVMMDDVGVDVIVAYNGRMFDMRVLLNHFPPDRVASWTRKFLDPFDVIRSTSGSWAKLDELLEANGLPRKTGEGVAAVRWWAEGDRQRVVDYCVDDVRGLVGLLSLGRFSFPVKGWTKRKNGEDARQVVVGWGELDWGYYLDLKLRKRVPSHQDVDR